MLRALPLKRTMLGWTSETYRFLIFFSWKSAGMTKPCPLKNSKPIQLLMEHEKDPKQENRQWCVVDSYVPETCAEWITLQDTQAILMTGYKLFKQLKWKKWQEAPSSFTQLYIFIKEKQWSLLHRAARLYSLNCPLENLFSHCQHCHHPS